MDALRASPGAASAAPEAFDRSPPYSPEAEISVLGGMLIDPDAVARAIEVVNDTMFFREAHRRLFRSMSRLFERGAAIDVVTLAEELKKNGEFDAAGGMEYLARLVDAVPTAANIEYHARIVREKALLRRLIEASSGIIRDAYEQGDKEVEEILDQAESRIFQVAQSQTREGFVWIKEILWSTFERIEDLQNSPGGVTGVSTGYPDLDRMTSGFQPGDLVIVAARPSMGKTSLVLNIAQNAAIGHQARVGIFSLEMSKSQLVERLLCAEGRIDLQRLRKGRMQPDEYQRLATAAGHLNSAGIWIDDTPGATVIEMRAKARRLKSETQLDMLVVDYMQLMSGSGRSESRVQEVSQISRGLKALARELEVPVVALSQLSRATEQRAGNRPQLSDLRESGAIEQDADVVMFLYREDYYLVQEGKVEEAREKEGLSELIIAKQRNGPTGTVPLYFHRAYTRFDSRARQEPGAASGGDGAPF
ncbi:MAG: replicative DNA helicase [Gemmatimonadetes bacterium]|nr:replicative DNA helicase [Gemmatimonadota bacterium]